MLESFTFKINVHRLQVIKSQTCLSWLIRYTSYGFQKGEIFSKDLTETNAGKENASTFLSKYISREWLAAAVLRAKLRNQRSCWEKLKI